MSKQKFGKKNVPNTEIKHTMSSRQQDPGNITANLVVRLMSTTIL